MLQEHFANSSIASIKLMRFFLKPFGVLKHGNHLVGIPAMILSHESCSRSRHSEIVLFIPILARYTDNEILQAPKKKSAQL